MELIWTKGMPSPEDVLIHETSHPYIDDRKQRHGGIWLMIDEQGHFGPHPSLIRLRTGINGEVIQHSRGIPHSYETLLEDTLVSGKILMQNGFSFWQLLERCRWADRAIYTPVSAKGIPLLWKP